MNNIEITKNEINIRSIEIKKSELWMWSLEISFNIKEEINYFDIFMILKSFCWNNIIPCYSVAFAKKNNDDNIVICEKESITKIRKINLEEFTKWLEWRISNDRTYKIQSNFYYILISFEKEICRELEINLDTLKPKYPWSESWMNFLKINEYRLEYLENKLKNAEKEIKKLNNLLEKKK